MQNLRLLIPVTLLLITTGACKKDFKAEENDGYDCKITNQTTVFSNISDNNKLYERVTLHSYDATNRLIISNIKEGSNIRSFYLKYIGDSIHYSLSTGETGFVKLNAAKLPLQYCQILPNKLIEKYFYNPATQLLDSVSILSSSDFTSGLKYFYNNNSLSKIVMTFFSQSQLVQQDSISYKYAIDIPNHINDTENKVVYWLFSKTTETPDITSTSFLFSKNLPSSIAFTSGFGEYLYTYQIDSIGNVLREEEVSLNTNKKKVRSYVYECVY